MTHVNKGDTATREKTENKGGMILVTLATDFCSV